MSGKPIAAIIALVALAPGAAPAAAEERLSSESAPFMADAYGDVIAWSSYDAVTQRHRLRLLRGGAAVDPAVAPSEDPIELDVGPGPDGAPLVVYSRDGDLFQYDPVAGVEQPMAEVNTPRTEAHPSILRSALAFVREGSGHPTVYLRRDGNTRRQPRPRVRRTLAVEGVELSSRGLFVVYRTDVVTACCARETLYRIVDGRLRHVFAVVVGGANFSSLVPPSVVGRNVYFGRANRGSRRRNRSFRYDLRSRRLSVAPGSRYARSLTWRGDRFLLSRDSSRCRFPSDDPTAAPGCALVLTDPIRFSPAARADVRRTRP